MCFPKWLLIQYFSIAFFFKHEKTLSLHIKTWVTIHETKPGVLRFCLTTILHVHLLCRLHFCTFETFQMVVVLFSCVFCVPQKRCSQEKKNVQWQKNMLFFCEQRWKRNTVSCILEFGLSANLVVFQEKKTFWFASFECWPKKSKLRNILFFHGCKHLIVKKNWKRFKK